MDIEHKQNEKLTCYNLNIVLIYPLLYINNQHLSFQCYATIFGPASCSKKVEPDHLPPQICIESHSSVTLFPVFYLKANLWCTKSLERCWMDLMCPLCLLVITGIMCRFIQNISFPSKEGLKYCYSIYVTESF